MPDRLYFTGNDEADALIAQDPLALLIGFALDQQVPVPTAFTGPLKIKQRLGTLEIARLDPAARDDRAVLGFVGEVEDEQLVRSGDRVLAGDVGGDGRTRSQDCWARIFALYARFFSW